MKVLIAPWGNPTRWKEVTYSLEGNNLKSKTSLALLQETVNPDKVIIIGLDTLAEGGLDYLSVKENAKEPIKSSVNFNQDLSVLVAPGIGVFKNGAFIGEALDYYYYILTAISLELLELFDDSIEIHLDLTHGLNYSTVLTYKAVKDISEVFSVFGDVKFKAYNADPFGSTDNLKINIIEDVKVVPRPFTGVIKGGSGQRVLEPQVLSPEERKNLYKEDLKFLREIGKSEISAFLGAMYNGLPLALFRFYPDRDKLKTLIDNVIENFEKYTCIENGDGKLNVKRKLRFGKDFEAYLFSYLTSVLLKKRELISSRKSEVEIKEIKKLANDLFNSMEGLRIELVMTFLGLKEIRGRKIISIGKLIMNFMVNTVAS